MPLLDHFHPPLSDERRWEGFHAAWASSIADELNRTLPEGFFAEEFVHVGVVPVTKRWTVPQPTATIEAVFSDDLEIRVISTHEGPRLVGAIELISPRNKDREEARRAFAIKCASYLHQGIGLIIVDIVSSRTANLHTEILSLLGQPQTTANQSPLYAVAYRPRCSQTIAQIELWVCELTLGQSLPTLALALGGEYEIGVDLEATYMDARRRRRLA
jgi:hypothetical protein